MNTKMTTQLSCSLQVMNDHICVICNRRDACCLHTASSKIPLFCHICAGLFNRALKYRVMRDIIDRVIIVEKAKRLAVTKMNILI